MSIRNKTGDTEPKLQASLNDSSPLCDTEEFSPQVESDKNLDSTQSCGRYHLESPLGKGSFGEVWKGTDPALNRQVAIKRLRSEAMTHPDAIQAFLDEGRKLAHLNHPGIVSVFDAGMSDGQPYIVSELIYGGSLANHLASGGFSIAETCRIIRELALALHYVHAHGVVHRDIKPQNILMKEGNPKLADFGLAVSEIEQLSERPGIVGTYSYMSPEQVRGDSHLVDGRSDLYSLGVVFYQMLTDRLPFLGETSQQLQEQILHREPRPLRAANAQIPVALEEICLKCLRKPIAERYTTTLDLANEVDAYLKALEERPKSSNRTLLWAGFALVVVFVAGVGAYINRPAPQPEQVPKIAAPKENQELRGIAPVNNLLGDLALQQITEYTLEPAGKHLNVTAYNRSLVSVGKAGEEDVEWNVSFSQPQWTGNIGVFFGFRPTGDNRHTQYHALYIFNVGNNRYLRASVYQFVSDNPNGVHVDHLLTQEKIDNFRNPQNNIGIRIHQGKLVHLEIQWKILGR